MDEEQTAGFRDPCAQCSAVDWAVSDESRFYCRTCHTVIEKTSEVVNQTFIPGSSRISTIGRGSRTKRSEHGRQWMICEGFQFILMNQANALLKLGVSQQFKDQVLCHMWRLYLQKTRQAYTHRPIRSSHFKVGPDSDLDSDSAPGSSGVSVNETDGEINLPSTAGSNAESSGDWSLYSGSVDAISYLSTCGRRSHHLMSMRKTLALVHLALVWSREGLTLSDLLRLVNDGHVPYINAYEELPEEMKLEGRDALLFRVESIPAHHTLHKEAEGLLLLLQLPPFPPISQQSLLHPAALSLRYLIDANLPDELHPWLCRLMERAGMMDQTLHTCVSLPRPVVPLYDAQAAALIIVTMKLLFGLDDHAEWDLSNQTPGHQHTGEQFNLRRWYRVLQAVLIRAQNKNQDDQSRRQWKPNKPLFPNRKEKSAVMKKKRVAEQLQLCFEKISSQPAGVLKISPSSFRFCWGDQDGTDGPSIHHKKVDGVLTLTEDLLTPRHTSYWHPALRPCRSRTCRSHYQEVESTLPQTFIWLLQLFSFLLEVKPACLYEEVLKVERRLFSSHPQTRKKKPLGPVGGM